MTTQVQAASGRQDGWREIEALTVLGRKHQVLDECSGTDALAAFAKRALGEGTPDQRAVGFCYSTVAARWFQLEPDGRIRAPGSDGLCECPLTGVFELRAFTPTHELRWQNRSGGRGVPIIVSDSEESGGLPGLEDQHLRLEHQRLLWGTVDKGHSGVGWARLRDGRIGTLDVPARVPRHLRDRESVRVRLRVVEYLAEDSQGNVSVLDERLSGLDVWEVRR